MSDPRIVMVAAVADNGVIGRDADIPWHIPEDMKHFREVTRGHTVVMGRVTYEGIGHPLPFRTNLVVTRQPGWQADGVLVAGSVEEAIEVARGIHADTGADIVIGGGTQVYEAAMPYATHQILTEVHQEPEGDTHYPRFDPAEWFETRREDRDGFEVRGDPVLGRLVVVGGHHEHAVGAELLGLHGELDGVGGVVGPDPGHHGGAVPDRLDDRAQQPTVLLGAGRRRLAGRPGDDHAVVAVGDEVLRDPGGTVEVDRPVVVERGDHRRQHAAERGRRECHGAKAIASPGVAWRPSLDGIG
jgi:dihydrofolate reductase